MNFDPQPKVNFEDIVGRDTLRADDDQVWTAHARWIERFMPLSPRKFEDSLGGIPARMFERFYSLIHAEPWAVVLDFGCGIAPLRDYFRPGLYAGLDRNAEAVELASFYWPKDIFIRHDGLPLPFPKATFDLAVAIGVLEHLDDEGLHPILEELRRVVRVSGRLLIWAETKYEPPYRTAVHGRFPDEWKAIVEQHDYKRIWLEDQHHLFRAL